MGSLHNAGWGAAHCCPGARLADIDIEKITIGPYLTGVVNGVLLETTDVAEFWQTLDNFEGIEYHAEITPARLVTGEYRRRVAYNALTG